MANSVDPDQTATAGSTLFASILNKSVMLGNYLQRTTTADDIFLSALRVTQIFQKHIQLSNGMNQNSIGPDLGLAEAK